MNSLNVGLQQQQGTQMAQVLFKILLVVLMVVAVYYIYRYVYAEPTLKSVTVFGPAKKASEAETLVASNAIPPFVEGGEYTVSFWVYINDWTHRNAKAKHVLSIGSPLAGTTGFESLLVYLGANTNSLHVRVQSDDIGITSNAPLTISNVAALFDQVAGVGGGGVSTMKGCDLEVIDMQRWVNVTIALNGRTTDVYLDGKLARSCVGTGFYRVPATGYQLNAHSFGGFGGFMSNLQVFDHALNPENVHAIYNMGPHGGQQSFIDWLRSIFSPTEIVPGEYPK